MLEQGDRRRAAIRDRVRDVPHLVRVEDVPVLERLGPGDSAGDSPLLPGFAESDQGPDGSSELHRLLLREVACLHHRHLAALVLAYEQQVDQADHIVISQPPQLREYLAGEAIALEAEHHQLDRSDGHLRLLSLGGGHEPCRSFCLATSNSSGVNAPES